MARKKSPSRKEASTVLHREPGQTKGEGWVNAVLRSKGLIVFLLLLAGIIWFGYYSAHMTGISGSDDREYASIARNIVEGKGVVRNFVYPVELHFFSKLPIPEFMHPPGYPLLLAGFFKLLGTSDRSALLPSHLSYFLILVVFFLFARKHLDRNQAVIATLILIFRREVLDMSLVALSEGVYTAVFLGFFVVLVEAKSLKGIFLGGLLLGASHSIRENIYPFLLPLFVYLTLYPEIPRWKKLLLFSGGFMIPIVPNLLRSLWATGSPFFSYGKFVFMTFTEKYPWLDIYREIQNPSLSQFLLNEGNQFLAKYFGNLATALKEIPFVSNPVLFTFFFADMFFWKIDPFWKKVKTLFLLLFISQIFFVSLITFTHRYFVPFVPLMVLFAVQGFFTVAGGALSKMHVSGSKKVLTSLVSLFLIILMVPALYTLSRLNRSPSPDSKNVPFGFLVGREEAEKLNSFLKTNLKEEQIVWTDFPEVLEWEGNRSCGWLPRKIEDLHQIQKTIPVDAILLTSLRTPQMEPEWNNLLSPAQRLPQYRHVKFYIGKNFSAKLLIRDEKE
jgi:4-amino-4-deoxy-L-arabinose transferase-like glycosyltransferase